jgi:hypothetical protein
VTGRDGGGTEGGDNVDGGGCELDMPKQNGGSRSATCAAAGSKKITCNDRAWATKERRSGAREKGARGPRTDR